MRLRRGRWVLAVASLAVASQGCVSAREGHHGHDADAHDHDATATHRFEDVAHWVRVFDDPARDEWQKPAEVVGFLGLREGDVVADLGAGTGYFMPYLSSAVGATGRLLAVDVETALIEHLSERAQESGASNVEVILADPADPKLPAGGVDVILIVDTWHHIDSRLDYLETLARALRPSGRVVVVDFREGELPVGPAPGHKLSRERVVAEFEEAGWVLEKESNMLPYQYLLSFGPGSRGGR